MWFQGRTRPRILLAAELRFSRHLGSRQAIHRPQRCLRLQSSPDIRPDICFQGHWQPHKPGCSLPPLPSVTPAPHAVWDAAIRASGQGEKQTNPSSHHHCIIPLQTGEYLNLPRCGYSHRMGERKQGEKPDCRAWVTSLFGGCLVDHWFEFEVHEAPRRRPQRLGFPSQGLGTLKPRFRSPAPRRDAAMPSTEQCGCTIHWHTFASPEREESIHNRIRHSCKPHPIHTRGLIDPSPFSFLSPCPT